MNFHTKFALSRLLAGQCEVEKKLMTKLQSRLQPFGEHAPPNIIEATCNIAVISLDIYVHLRLNAKQCM